MLDIDLHTANGIDHINQRIKIHRHIVFNIHIQILIEHSNGPLRTSISIGRIGLVQRSITLLQESITIHR